MLDNIIEKFNKTGRGLSKRQKQMSALYIASFIFMLCTVFT